MAKAAVAEIQIKTVYSERWPRCGHCVTGYHQSCAVGTFQAGPPQKYPYGAIILCGCEQGGCELGRRKCLKCNSRSTEDIDPANWVCFDRNACEARIEEKRAANPLIAQLREAKERSEEMAKTQSAAKKTAAKKTAAPKVGKCLVTGKETKGGLFLPGMDARYASERVGDVMEKRATKPQALAKMKEDGVSEKLIAKFEKNLGIAQDKVAKKAADDKAKAEAKKAAAADKSSKDK